MPTLARRRFAGIIGGRGEPDSQEDAMPRIVRGALIQATLCEPATAPVATSGTDTATPSTLDYNAFLQAYQSGLVKRLAVVSTLK